MYAMQYGFLLPADYDMSIIHRRITERGHRTDGLAGLRFKAYLAAERQSASLPSRDNLYAPFYLWDDNEGMNAFLCGSGFNSVIDAFGRPSVSTWSVWNSVVNDDLTSAVCASSQRENIPLYAALDAWRQREAQHNADAMADGAVAALSAFEPTTWSLVRFRLWPQARPDLARDEVQLYTVGHVSTGLSLDPH